MNIPENLKYTKEHEWVKVDGEFGYVGITDYAQEELSDIVYVEVPEIGKHVEKGDTLTTLEAVKTVADVFSPVSGEIVEANEGLNSNPGIINNDPYGEGWIVKIKLQNPDEINELLSAEEYKTKIEE